MRYYRNITVALVGFLLTACMGGQNGGENTSLSAKTFSEKLASIAGGTLLDVRSPGEFEGGHIENAQNLDWNGDLFNSEIAKLDKTRPVFVYCLSGGRSSSAASAMRSSGFVKVYELQGGLMKWRAAGLPETTNNTIKEKGLSKEQFTDMLKTDKLVLVDFYAEWCAPCKKMKPYLDEISEELKDRVLVLRIDADVNKSLMYELGIDELPILHVYKKGVLNWSNRGFIDKKGVLEHLQ